MTSKETVTIGISEEPLPLGAVEASTREHNNQLAISTGCMAFVLGADQCSTVTYINY
jgi:hypothetical protein